MVNGDFLTPEQMNETDSAAAAESDAAMRTFLDKNAEKNGKRLANGVDRLMKSIKPSPTLLESPVTGKYGNFMDLSREARQIGDTIQQRQNALNAAAGPQLVPYDPKLDNDREIFVASFNNMINSPMAAINGGATIVAGGSPSDVYYSTQLGVSQDGILMAGGAIGGSPRFTGATRTPEIVRDGRAGPASDAIEFENLKENYRARDVGRINLDRPSNVWNRSMQDLRNQFQLDGYTSYNNQTRTTSKSEVYALEGHPEILQIQVSPPGETHNSQYYKFMMRDGAEVKIIDPATYNPRTVRSNTTFFDTKGNSGKYENGKWIPR
ncbi:hypothetical protein [Duganella sp. HH101]|uniref:hypothetical protein n=1 Tax=Duganella sp. HH101 TaxID=1781066 RepID=UPI000893AA9F|nr:hypothetical protein [Duganella sp. HH101]OFA06688.1 hypothetical protein DUGA2_00160 [Duganella sp. HH101]